MRLALLLVQLVLIQVSDCSGIPVFMTTSMRVMGIAQIVKELEQVMSMDARPAENITLNHPT